MNDPLLDDEVDPLGDAHDGSPEQKKFVIKDKVKVEEHDYASGFVSSEPVESQEVDPLLIENETSKEDPVNVQDGISYDFATVKVEPADDSELVEDGPEFVEVKIEPGLDMDDKSATASSHLDATHKTLPIPKSTHRLSPTPINKIPPYHADTESDCPPKKVAKPNIVSKSTSQFVCPFATCQFVTNDLHKLDAHKTSHRRNNVSFFPCPDFPRFCRVVETNKDTLHSHLKRHLDKKGMECRDKACSFRAHFKSSVAVHEKLWHPEFVQFIDGVKMKKAPFEEHWCEKCHLGPLPFFHMGFHYSFVHKVAPEDVPLLVIRSKANPGLGSVPKSLPKSEKVTYKCNDCGFYGKTKGSVLRHQQGKHEQNCNDDTEPCNATYRCKECEFTAGSKEAIWHHQDEIHNAVSVEEMKRDGKFVFGCPECVFQTREREQFDSHLTQKHPAFFSLKCPICDEFCQSQRELHKHLTGHLLIRSDGELQCLGCVTERRFDSREKFRTHVSVSHRQCFFCPFFETVGGKDSLERHMAVKHSFLLQLEATLNVKFGNWAKQKY